MPATGIAASAPSTPANWAPMRTARVMFGDPQHPTLKDDNVVMMLFVSERGKRLRDALAQEPIYVGSNTW